MQTQATESKVIVITGASSGFGRGAALALSPKGHKLVLAARRGEVLHDVIEECVRHRGTGVVNAVSVEADVSCRKDVQAIADKAVETFGRIDVWINDAGVGAIGPFEQVPIEDHQKVVETNLIGTIHGCHAALQQFLRQALGELPPADARPTQAKEWSGVTGIIINVASVLGKFPSPYFASYAASKYGVVGLGAALRQEMHERGLVNVRVCTVMPATYDTPFFQHVSNFSGHETVAPEPLHDPREVIDALVSLIEKPQDEVIVGAAGRVTNALHKVFPGVVERFMGHQTHEGQIEKAPSSPRTRGAVHGPMREGTSVSGIERAKKKREKGK